MSGNADKVKGEDIQLSSMEVSLHGKISESCKCGYNTHIQAGYPEPCKIPGSNSCKACMCLLNSVPQRQWLPLDHWQEFAIRMQSLAVINDAIEEGNGKQASLPQMPRPLVYSLCQTFLITVLWTPSSAGFQFSQLGTGYYSQHERWMQLTTW